MEDSGMPLAIGIIIGAAILGVLILAGLVVAAVLAI
jgi:hypothetical protein